MRAFATRHAVSRSVDESSYKFPSSSLLPLSSPRRLIPNRFPSSFASLFHSFIFLLPARFQTLKGHGVSSCPRHPLERGWGWHKLPPVVRRDVTQCESSLHPRFSHAPDEWSPLRIARVGENAHQPPFLIACIPLCVLLFFVSRPSRRRSFSFFPATWTPSRRRDLAERKNNVQPVKWRCRTCVAPAMLRCPALCAGISLIPYM
jgi:hypothetical protein